MSEMLQLVLVDQRPKGHQPYVVEFGGVQQVGTYLRHRHGRNRLNEPVVQRIAHGGQAARDLLRREWDLGVLLHERLSADSYPPQLSEVIGYGVESPVPIMVSTARGEALETMRDKFPLPTGELVAVVDDILRGLRWLSAARVVHGRIGLSTIRWDGTAVQFAEFEHAVQEGQSYPPCPCHGSPNGDRPASHRDDVYAAALVVYHLYTGEEVDVGSVIPAQMRTRLALQDGPLRILLDGVFADRPQDRPDSRVLLRRRSLTDPSRRGVPDVMSDRESRARQQFSALRERQMRFRGTYLYSLQAGRGVQVERLPAVSGWLLAVVASVVLVVLVLVLVFV